MMRKILVLYGSYRSDRKGIRLANFLVEELRKAGNDAELIDAKAVGLPILDRMYKEYPKGEAPANLEVLADKIKAADAFMFVVGEYNWGVQPGLKNLTDHFLEEWFWRPAAIASYSAGRLAGVRAAMAWRNTLSEMGMVVVSSSLAVPQISTAFDDAAELVADPGGSIGRSTNQMIGDLIWWTDAATAQRASVKTPY
ncbi:NADPH-dependent FMN reductase [Rhizobium sp. HT1-10]|uniref:NADPH-dependent FMN reductase n=1 Tax=Rhizobium sp. HT1-10 TaxID=3111638 RepID=UPI003C25300B